MKRLLPTIGQVSLAALQPACFRFARNSRSLPKLLFPNMRTFAISLEGSTQILAGYYAASGADTFCRGLCRQPQLRYGSGDPSGEPVGGNNSPGLEPERLGAGRKNNVDWRASCGLNPWREHGVPEVNSISYHAGECLNLFIHDNGNYKLGDAFCKDAGK